MSALVPAKITPQHLQRAAYVYVRQSTLTQVHEHLESQRRQYALAEHARTWGWQHVEIVDDDCGFRLMAITRFGRSRSPVSLQADHPFRPKPITA